MGTVSINPVRSNVPEPVEPAPTNDGMKEKLKTKLEEISKYSYKAFEKLKLELETVQNNIESHIRSVQAIIAWFSW